MKHTDGSICDKTPYVPTNFKACCKSFDFRTRSCRPDLKFRWYDTQFSKDWGIELHDGSYIQIEFCPFCGREL